MKLAELMKLQLDEQNKLVADITKRKAKAKDATKTWKDSTPELGKLYCVLEIRLHQGQRTHDVDGKPTTPTFAQSKGIGDMIYDVTKDKPDGKALQCKNAFSTFVGIQDTGLVTEKVYDNLPSSVLEISGRIAKELGFDLSKPEIGKVAEELNAYGKNTIGNLRDMLKALVPAEAMELADAETEVAKFDTDGNMAIIIAALVKRAPGTVAEILANEIPIMNSLQGQRVYLAHLKAEAHFTPALLATWSGGTPPTKHTVAFKVPEKTPEESFQDLAVKLSNEETFRDLAVKFYGEYGMDDGETAAAAGAVKDYYVAEGKLPATAVELDAWMEGTPVETRESVAA